MNPVSAAYIKACEDYLGVHQAIFEQFNNRTAPAAAFGVPPAFLDAWKSLAQNMGAQVGVPALGPAREHLEIVQKMTDLGLQFQRKYAEFTAHLAGIPQDAMRGIQHPGAGTTYDEWIESAESAYAALAHGATFARLLGELCNTLNALKVQRENCSNTSRGNWIFRPARKLIRCISRSDICAKRRARNLAVEAAAKAAASERRR